MEKLKSDTNPKGVRIYFDDIKHEYFTDNVKDFTSVTNFIQKFFEAFDSEKISLAYARKYNLSQKEVLADWDRKKTNSQELGSNIHEYCEAFLLGKPLPAPINKKAESYITVAKAKLEELVKVFNLEASEKIIFSERLKLCGTADIILRHKKTNRLYLLDFKTSSEISKENKFGKFAYHPVTHLPDNNYTQYSLQLNAYRKLLLLECYYAEDISLGLIHFTLDKPYSHGVNIMDNEIDLMIHSETWKSVK